MKRLDEATPIADSRLKDFNVMYKDPRWQKKRLEILQRDQWTCRSCKSTEKTLHVHHLTYKGNINDELSNDIRKKKLWEFPDESLITLCEYCHRYEHEERWNYESDLLQTLKIKGYLIQDIEKLIVRIMNGGE